MNWQVEKTRRLFLFFNAFFAKDCNMFVQQQQQYHKMTMDEFMDFYQICHTTDQPLSKQPKYESTYRIES